MAFQGRHGARPAERENAQEFKVDLEIECDIQKAAETDDLDDTIDYTKLRAIVRDVIEGPHANLLETLASTIARRVLEERRVMSVSVTVNKRPASMHPIEAAAVHIRRTRASSD